MEWRVVIGCCVWKGAWLRRDVEGGGASAGRVCSLIGAFPFYGMVGVLSDWSIPFRGRGFGGKGVLSDWSIPFLWIFSSQVGYRVSLACYEKIFISGIRIVAPSKGMMECVSCH